MSTLDTMYALDVMIGGLTSLFVPSTCAPFLTPAQF